MCTAHHAIAALASLTLSAPLALAQSGTLYLTNEAAQTGYIVNGMNATSFALMNEGESPIVVTNEIRTSGTSSATPGSAYHLNGTHKGGDYFRSSTLGGLFDAGTDGTNIFVVEYETRDVYRTDMNFGNAEFLFEAGDSSSEILGITYNALTESVWVSEWAGTELIEYDLEGNELSRFGTGHVGSAALAYDSTDNTLWLHDHSANNFAGGIYEQWTLGGERLFRGEIAGLGGGTLGGEFGAIPAPGTLALLGAAAALGSRRRR